MVVVSTARFQALVTLLNNLINNTAAHNSNPGRDSVFSGAILDFEHSKWLLCLYCGGRYKLHMLAHWHQRIHVTVT